MPARRASSDTGPGAPYAVLPARFRDLLLECLLALLGGAPFREVSAHLLARLEAAWPGSRASLHARMAARALGSCGDARRCALRAPPPASAAGAVCRDCLARGRHRVVASLGAAVLLLELEQAPEATLASDLGIVAGALGTLGTLGPGAACGARQTGTEQVRTQAQTRSQTQTDGRADARALARELHDSVAQQLGLMSFMVSQMQQQARRAQVSEPLVGELRGLVTRLQRQVRELITSARLTHDGRSLRQALADSVEEFARRCNVVFELDNRMPELRLAPEVELHLLQIAREALSNVVRHSHARHAWVELVDDGAGGLLLSVTDDGLGLTPASADQTHHGLNILRERAKAIGAQIAIGNAEAPGGARIALHLTDLDAHKEPAGGAHDTAAD